MTTLTRSSIGLMATAVFLALSGAALADTAVGGPSTPTSGVSQQQSIADGADAQVAAERGDWAAEVRLAASAYRGNPSVVNEFNLATGYQHTNQSILAIPLYQGLAVRAQNVRTQALYDYRDAPYPAVGRRMDATIGQESARRLNMIAGDPAPFSPYPYFINQ